MVIRLKIKYLILIILFITANFAYSQKLKNFTHEDEKFLKEIRNFLEKGKKKEGRILMDSFESVWQEEAFSESDKEFIFSSCDLMLKKRASAFPLFANFFELLIAFHESEHNTESFEEWKKAILQIFGNKKVSNRKIDQMFVQTRTLLLNNTIYKSVSVEWKTPTGNFRFVSDDKKFLKVVFDKTDIVCYAKKDSSLILETKGEFLPLEQLWLGSGGIVPWHRANFDISEASAKLKSYEINLKKSAYTADSVFFDYERFSDKPIPGRLEEKIVAINDTSRIKYPKFISYEKRFNVPNIYKGINYEGGFAMHGAKFIGSGTEKEDVFLEILYKDSVFLRAGSQSFLFKRDMIIAQNTTVTFYLDTDSIYHPGLEFKFSIKNRTLTLNRNGIGIEKSPYFNTFHQIDMDFEVLEWKIDNPKILFKAKKGNSEATAFFESNDFFSEERYKNIQGMDDVHPFVSVYKFAAYYHSREFGALAYANYLRKPLYQVKQQLMTLAYSGYISYDTRSETVVIRDKLLNYMRANSKKKDYDVINFYSATKNNNNGQFSLLDYSIKLFGVKTILLSDSQNVVIHPLDGELLLKKNRDFEFDGKIKAGLFDFYGKKLEFDYEDFKIKLTNIDSIRIWAKTGEKDNWGRNLHRKVKSVLQDITGDLKIDYPTNKSGKEDFPSYPIFNSKNPSYVYYDKKHIQKGVYNKENFYFQVFPFKIDSLDNFSTDGLEFDGHFTPASIFPSFDEKLKIQSDFSLGFIRSTPTDGFPAYQNKGVYKNEIRLSHRGLRGDGELNYLRSTTLSDDYIFFPDSMNTHANKFNNIKTLSGIEYPSVEADSIYIHWEPWQDQMIVHKKKIPMQMYDKEAIIHGAIVLEPTGMRGWGKMEFVNAELSSPEFIYSADVFDADTSNFDLKSAGFEGFAFKTHNVNSHIDFIERTGEFLSNDSASFVEFPKNQYVCYMDMFTWFMEKEEIDMSVSSISISDRLYQQGLSPDELEDVELDGAIFTSVHPKQDSLEFISPVANYNLQKHLITAREVRLLKVADATIYPGDGEIIVEKKAIMRTLDSAKIVANNASRYHIIYESTVNIFGAKDYSANGKYDYIDELNRKQTIKFDVVAVDTAVQTYASGTIIDSMLFTLSPHFNFEGDVRLNADNEFLTFTGAVRISHECETLNRRWIKFSEEIDPNNILIPIAEKPKDRSGTKLYAGLMLNKDSAHIYSSFMNKPKRANDLKILNTSGYLYYDNINEEYQISNKEKLEEFNLPGNFLSLNKKNCVIYGEGELDFGLYFGQMKVNPMGSITHDLVKDSVELNVMMSLDFFFDKNLLKDMSQTFIDDPNLEPTDMSTDIFIKGLAIMLGTEKSDELLYNLSLHGEYRKFPKELEHTMLLTDVILKWNSSTDSYHSVGEIGVGNILKNEVNRYVDGKIELIKRRGGDEITVFLQTDYSNWYFFTYRRNLMQVLSSNDIFNQTIVDMKQDKRKNSEKGEAPFSYILSSDRKKRMFIERFNEEYEILDYYEDEDE
ncbi:MAG: hypothetical protein HN704_14805 [Bacteroidetes bacterium]|jgi:hypothetical protein|nr:hypothetical protein [Bacteroidota bacterium]MBT7143669.1 hypothetical protein [Bacteroidota bacterium]MBT7492868.1 hypothetical protein [Bacteroidota bacterium]